MNWVCAGLCRHECNVIYEWLAVLPHYYLTKRKWCTGTVWHHTPRAFALAEVV